MSPSNRSFQSGSRRGGFTLLEIMIVVSVVLILSWLAMVVIGRIQQRAARSLIENNLRQLYQAKEYYFSESGAGQPTSIPALAARGYLSVSVKDRLMNAHSFEANKGWHYYPVVVVGAPVAAYQGSKQAGFAPKGEIIYYPGPPNSSNDVFGVGGAIGATGPGVQPPTGNPPIGTQPPPLVVRPPAVVAQPPVVVAQPPAVVAQPPAVVAQPPAVVAQPPSANKPPTSNALAVPPLPGNVSPPRPVLPPPAKAKGPSGQPPQVPPKPNNPPAHHDSPDVVATATSSPIVISGQTGAGNQPQVLIAPPSQQTFVSAQPAVVTPPVNQPPATAAIQFDDNLSAFVRNDKPLQTRPIIKRLTVEVEFRGGQQQVAAVGGHSATILSYTGATGSLDGFVLRNPESLTITMLGRSFDTHLNLNDGQVHRLTATWVSDSGEMLLYDNGRQVWSGVMNRGLALSGQGTLVLGQSQSSLLSGGRYNSIDAFRGEIFSASMASEDLSASEVQQGSLGSVLGPNVGLITEIKVTPAGVVDTTGRNTYSTGGSARPSTP